MNEIIKAIKGRRSIRKFKPDMPKKEDLEQIIEAGLYAANGVGKQAVITVAVTKKEIRDRLSATAPPDLRLHHRAVPFSRPHNISGLLQLMDGLTDGVALLLSVHKAVFPARLRQRTPLFCFVHTH